MGYLVAKFKENVSERLHEKTERFLELLNEELFSSSEVLVTDVVTKAGFPIDDAGIYHTVVEALYNYEILDARTEYAKDPENDEPIEGVSQKGVVPIMPPDIREGLSGVDEDDVLYPQVFVKLRSGKAAPEPEGDDDEAASQATLDGTDDSSMARRKPRYRQGEVLRGEKRLAVVVSDLASEGKPGRYACLVYPDIDFENLAENPAKAYQDSEQEFSGEYIKKAFRRVAPDLAEDVLNLRRTVVTVFEEGDASIAEDLYLQYLEALGEAKDGEDLEIKNPQPSLGAMPSQEVDEASMGNQDEGEALAPRAGAEGEGDESHFPAAAPLFDDHSEEGDGIPQSTETAPPRATSPRAEVVSLGRTTARAKRLLANVLGGALFGVMICYVILERNNLIRTQRDVASQIGEPAENFRLVRIQELDELKLRLKLAEEKNAASEAEKGAAVRAAVAETTKRVSERMEVEVKAAIERGREEGLGLGDGAKDRIALLSQTKAVVNGECDAYGRGNWVDRIHPENMGVDVLFWLVDPTTLRTAGAVVQNSKLMNVNGYPVSRMICIAGKGDVWPSFGAPVRGKDGRDHPLDGNGNALETNALLQ